MNQADITDSMQWMVVRLICQNPAGVNLLLIGGFRYQLLDESCRRSRDLDYHWAGDLAAKQRELVELLRRKLLPELKARFGYDGRVDPDDGPGDPSPAVRVVKLTAYQPGTPDRPIEIDVDLTRIVCLDPPITRTVEGMVVPSASDADMVESKVVALLERRYVAYRDMLDLFLFQQKLRPDFRERVRAKLTTLAAAEADVRKRMTDFREARDYHVKGIDRILNDEVNPSAAGNLRVSGGAPMIYDQVMGILEKLTGGRA